MADLDGDGNDDVLSGSYWPGDIFLFHGAGKGAYRKGEILKAKDGKNVNAGGPWPSAEEPDMDSLAASPWLVDWDGDGDLDLLIGNITGRVVLIHNEGDGRQAVFGKKELVRVGGEPVAVAGDAGPHTADWDGDGLWDLIVGSDDGSVQFYRNTGSRTEPRFAAGTALVPGIEHGAHMLGAGVEPQRPGMRTKVCVADWNGDGLLDLLVGDFVQARRAPSKLDAEGEKQLAALKRKGDALEKEMDELNEGELDEQQIKRLETIGEELGRVWQQIEELEGGQDLTGYVWVYLRKPDGERGSRDQK